ncbi:MAG: iron ABC transporter permease [Rhodospirillales bacterium]|nr:iron ABC transporter permease [Rhodospirillales bacterium]
MIAAQKFRIIPILCLLLACLMFSLFFGQAPLGIGEVVTGLFSPPDEPLSIIVRELRLPRVIIGFCAGASLGLSGAALQGLLRNPLADPGIIGVSASASLGAVIAIYLGFATIWSFAIPIMAMGCALVAIVLLFAMASRDGRVLTLILTGIGISSLATACISLVMNFAPTPMSLRDMVMWLLGSLENRTTEDLYMMAPFVLAGWAMLIGVGQGLNALALGEDAAHSLGININRLRWRIVLGTALSVGATVAVCGSIGFIGLVVPHLMRAVFGSEPRNILLPSAIGGAILLTIADIATRVPVGHIQLRLGVLTAFIGAPVFLYIIYRARENIR